MIAASDADVHWQGYYNAPGMKQGAMKSFFTWVPVINHFYYCHCIVA